MLEFAKNIPKPKVRTYSDEEWYEQQMAHPEDRDIVDMDDVRQMELVNIEEEPYD